MADKFLLEEIPKKCFQRREVMVFLGNENSDVNWILDQLKTFQKQSSDQLMTVYNPKNADGLDHSEAPRHYLVHFSMLVEVAL